MKKLGSIKFTYFLLLLLLGLITLTSSHPPNPCPELFQYQFDGAEWFGLIKLTNIQLGQRVQLKVNLSVRALLPTRYVGELNLLEGRQRTLQGLLVGNPVAYKIRFPIQEPLPRVTQINANNQLICSGPEEIGPQTTRIQLENTLYTTLLDRFGAAIPSSNLNSLIQNNNIQIPNSFLNNQELNNGFPHNHGSNNGFLNNQGLNNVFPNNQISNPFLNNNNQNSNPFTDNLNNNAFYDKINNNVFRQPDQTTFSSGIDIRVPNTNSNSNSFTPGAPPIRNSGGPPSSPPSTSNISTSSNTCGTIDPKFNIRRYVVGGNKLQRGAWPWLIAVYLSGSGGLEFKCGGNLVSSSVTVTAAHCFSLQGKRYGAEDVLIALGRYNLRNWNEPGSMIVGSSGVHIHPDYSDDLTTFDADLAIVILKTAVTFTDTIRPICLWSGSQNVGDIEGTDGTVVGWGKDENGNEVSPEPKKVQATIYSFATCIKVNDLFRPITSRRNFCAGLRNGEGPCTGDSGSGLMVYRNERWELRGTVAGSLSDVKTNTCNLNEFIVYVDITKFTDWIRTFM